MEQDKKCPACKRTYRGEGYEGLCTSSCWFTQNRPRTPLKKKENPFNQMTAKPQKVGKTPQQLREERLMKANKKWLDTPYVAEKPSKSHIGAKIERARLYDSGSGWLKKFNAVRG